ncbi:MAG: hypothetical protein AB7S92_10630 [Parvibaculaceae bacterium]
MPKTTAPGSDERARIEELLDDALRATFPASDPIAVTAPRTGEPAAMRRSGEVIPLRRNAR